MDQDNRYAQVVQSLHFVHWMGGLGGKQEPGRWDPRIFGRRRPLPLMLAASVQKSDDVEAQRIEIGQMAQEDRPI